MLKGVQVFLLLLVNSLYNHCSERYVQVVVLGIEPMTTCSDVLALDHEGFIKKSNMLLDVTEQISG